MTTISFAVTCDVKWIYFNKGDKQREVEEKYTFKSSYKKRKSLWFTLIFPTVRMFLIFRRETLTQNHYLHHLGASSLNIFRRHST